jgi:hypothetical protein
VITVTDLQREFDYYLAHQDELVRQHSGKFLVIKDEQVAGVFDDELEAYKWATENYELGSFLLQFCTPGDEAYSQTFYSRVAI